jgi:photosystem II stability/assembly factor-like uncharacterized protein
LLCLATWLFLSPSDRLRTRQEDEKESFSMAWHALQFLGNSAAYPNADIPPDAFAKAYQFYRENYSGRYFRSTQVADWVSEGPTNIGGRTSGFAIDPVDTSVIWLGAASGGLWKSTSGGRGQNAWTYIPTGFPVRGVSTIAINPQNRLEMYIGTGETYSYGSTTHGFVYRPARGSNGIGILKSVDGGSTWTHSLNWLYQQTRGVWEIRINPLQPATVFAATTEGVFRSRDAGASWQPVLNELMVMDLALDPVDTNTVYAAVGNAGSPSHGIYRSTDGGDTWLRLSNGLPPDTTSGRIQLRINPLNHRSLIAVVGSLYETVGIFRSYDKGNTWNSIAGLTEILSYQGWYSTGLCFNAADTNAILFGGVWLYRSDLAGDFPQLVNNTYDIHPDLHGIHSNPLEPQKVYILTDGGLYRSGDFGETFEDCNSGYVTTQAYIGSVSLQDPTAVQCGLQDNNTIRSLGGGYWQPVVGGDGSFNAVDPDNDFIQYASLQFLNVFKSYDQGFSYNEQIISKPASAYGGNTAAFVAPFVIAPSNTNVLYAGADTLFRSDDAGFSFYAPGNRPINADAVSLAIAVSSTDPDVVYVTTAPTDVLPMGVWRSDDGGVNMLNVSAGLPNRYPRDIDVDPRDSRIVYVAFSGFGSGHLFRSSDGGANWTDISTTLPDVPFHCIQPDIDHPDTLYAGSDLGVFVSTDAGSTWDAFNQGLPDGAMVFDLKKSTADNSLLAFTHGNGVYRVSLGALPVGVDLTLQQPGFQLALMGNPVRDELLLRLGLGTTGLVQFRIFDLQGRLIDQSSMQGLPRGMQLVRLPAPKTSGAYLLEVSQHGKRRVVKFVSGW